MSKRRLFVNLEDRSVRMFDNNFLDYFSRVHWTVPIFIYVPVICYAMYVAVADTSLAWWAISVGFAGGIVLWTFMEYFLHRFVFHYHPTSELGKKIHFMTHGVHHDYPQDSMRLVMPPAVSLPLAVFFFFSFRLIFGAETMWPIYSGFVLAYLSYDILHYATHHFHWNWGWFKALKKHHMDHHYREPDLGFGVTNTVWDKVFGTEFEHTDNKDKK